MFRCHSHSQFSSFRSPHSCGLCCENDKEYRLKTDHNAMRACVWMKNLDDDTRDQYCNSWNNGRKVKDACPKTCEFCLGEVILTTDDSPSASLTVTTTMTTTLTTPSTCINNASFTTGTGKNCNWIGKTEKRRKRLCVKDAVREGCPQTCGLCCLDSPTFKFSISPQKQKKCRWLKTSQNRRDEFCTNWIGNTRKVQDECQVSCDICMDEVVLAPSTSPISINLTSGPTSTSGTPSPTGTPTSKPSPPPSAKPTTKPSPQPTANPTPLASEFPSKAPHPPTPRPTTYFPTRDLSFSYSYYFH